MEVFDMVLSYVRQLLRLHGHAPIYIQTSFASEHAVRISARNVRADPGRGIFRAADQL